MRGDEQARELRDRAAALRARGKHRRALELYLELEALEPRDGSWARRAGELHRTLGETAAAVEAFGRAADRYAAAGFLVRAIAVCQVILRIDPAHELAQARLAQLSAARALPAADAVDLEPGQPVGSLPLAELLPGSRALGTAPVGVIDIPIDLEPEPEPGADLAARLASVPLFSDLPPASLTQLIEEVRLVELPAGQVLFRDGDAGRALYVVSEGAVAVSRGGVHLARLGEGAFFGEVALITEEPRTAVVIAEVDTELLAIDRDAIAALVAREPGVLQVLLRFLRDRLVAGLVATSPLFSGFAGDQRRELAQRFRLVEARPGTVLITEGQEAAGLFVALSGRLSVTRAAGGELARLGPGDVFGEMSLLSGAGAVASVVAQGKVLALFLPAGTFREVIMTHPQVLAFVGELASRREQSLAPGGEWEELRLDLF